MIDKIINILQNVCDIDKKIQKDTELIDSSILDSYALIQFIYELEKLGIELQLTQISKENLRYPYLIASYIENKIY